MFLFKKNTIKEEKKIPNRQTILDNIHEANGWGPPENRSGYSIIQKNIEWLKKNLDLNKLHNEIALSERYNNFDNKLSGWLTNRQMHCMLLINNNIRENNVQGAYHELYDFIASYNINIDKKIDMVERIIIRNAIIDLERLINLNYQ